jgi:hypothetical protein
MDALIHRVSSDLFASALGRIGLLSYDLFTPGKLNGSTVEEKRTRLLCIVIPAWSTIH